MYEFTRTNDGRIQFAGPVSIDTLWRVAEQIYAEAMYRTPLADPGAAAKYVAARIGTCDSEQFMAVFLDTRHRVVAAEVLFHGTIDGASVHPREVVKRAIHHNAAAVLIAHNHPSGILDASAADRSVTNRLRDALALVEIRLLDHFIVSGTRAQSLAALGYL